MLTGDGRYVEMAATLEYTIDRSEPGALERFAFTIADSDAALRPLAESAVREVVARRELLDLLTAGRRQAEDAAASLLRQRLAAYRFGIAVRRVEFQDIHPPLAVLDAYRDVSRAVSDRQRRVNEAIAYRDRIVTEAGGRSRAIGQAAEADRNRRLTLAAATADTFGSLLDARNYAPRSPISAFSGLRSPRRSPARRSCSWTRSRGVTGTWSSPTSPTGRSSRRSGRSPARPRTKAGRPERHSARTGRPPARHEATPMKKASRWTIAACVLAALAGVAASSLVVVDETEFAVVTSFGRIAAVYGVEPSGAGLHPKAPGSSRPRSTGGSGSSTRPRARS